MTNSFWLDSAPQHPSAPLDKNYEADVLIIGAGITGLTAAYRLSQQGRRVTVIDAGELWHADTGHTTAHLTEEMDFGYAVIEGYHGEKNARAAHESQREAIRFIETTSRELGIDCNFKRVDAYLFLHPTDEKKSLHEELEAVHKLGWQVVKMLPEAPDSPFPTGPCLRFPQQAQFHPLKYLSGLAKAIRKNGGEFFSRTHAAEVHPHKVITDSGHEITAKEIIVATHAPVKNILFFLKEAAYRTYVIAAEVPKGLYTHALYWDSGNMKTRNEAYHYVRFAEKNDQSDLLIVGGEDHKTGQADDGEMRFQKLAEWAHKRFPAMSKIEYRWSGQVIEPDDGLPFIGKSPYHDQVYIATGYSGNGMTNGTVAGLLLSDMILGIENPLAHLYSPTRKKLKSTGDFASENLNVAKEFFADRVKKEEKSAEDLAPGEGAVVQCGLRKIAAYRDESGTLHQCSAVCTHLGGIVQWNAVEKSFDCPLHGSRFSAKGEVIMGPAIRDLKKEEKRREAA